MECYGICGTARKERKTKEQLKVEAQEREIAAGKEKIFSLNAQLTASKRFNKAAIAMIVIMLILMSFMLTDMQHLTNQYEQLEKNYEKLYEEVKAVCISDR